MYSRCMASSLLCAMRSEFLGIATKHDEKSQKRHCKTSTTKKKQPTGEKAGKMLKQMPENTILENYWKLMCTDNETIDMSLFTFQ